jgi:hypothetical protein
LAVTQLGVNSWTAIYSGGLANKPAFFGSGTAEVVSRAIMNLGGWNNDYAGSMYSSGPWHSRGGFYDVDTSSIGIYAFIRSGGGIDSTTSHRTILSGY